MLENPLRRCYQHQIASKNQTVDPAASSSDTPVDSIVTIYPINTDYERALQANTLVGVNPTVNG